MTTYDYDALGNLRSVELPDARHIEYLVDGAQRRVGRRVFDASGTLTDEVHWLYQGALNPVAELDAQGNIRKRFVYGSKGHVPDYMVTYDASGVETGTYRLVTDHLGSVRLVVDTSDGTVAQRMSYDAFGNILDDTHEGFQPFGFAGGRDRLSSKQQLSTGSLILRSPLRGGKSKDALAPEIGFATLNRLTEHEWYGGRKMNRFFRWVYSDMGCGNVTTHLLAGIALGLDSVYLRVFSDRLFDYLIWELGDYKLSHSSSTLVHVSMRICYADSRKSRNQYAEAQEILEDGLAWVDRVGMCSTSILVAAETPVGLLNLLDTYSEILSLRQKNVPVRFLPLIEEVTAYFELEHETHKAEISGGQLEDIVRESREKLTKYYVFIHAILKAAQENDPQKSRQNATNRYLQTETVEALRVDARRIRDMEIAI